MKAIDSASNFIRAVVSLVILGIIAFASWIGYSMLNDAKQAELAIQELKETKAQLREVSDKLLKTETALRLMKVDRRVATIEIDDQYKSEDGRWITELRFIELGPDEKPVVKSHPGELPGKPFTIDTRIVHVSALVVKFKDIFVETGDSQRGASICLLQSIYGHDQAPSQGHRLDEPGERPVAYGQDPISEFERKIWTNIWEYANDPQKAEAAGIRAAGGEAPYMLVEKGKTYRLELRASGGLTLKPANAHDAQPHDN
ncbi:MAG: hypothetical protein MPJ50_07625 [Pirellulales bacterium]|nr:hypothetical protein [Pirellulales bacterium]